CDSNGLVWWVRGSGPPVWWYLGEVTPDRTAARRSRAPACWAAVDPFSDAVASLARELRFEHEHRRRVHRLCGRRRSMDVAIELSTSFAREPWFMAKIEVALDPALRLGLSVRGKGPGDWIFPPILESDALARARSVLPSE